MTSDPESYSLVTQAAYDLLLEDTNESVIQAIADAREEGVAEGITNVTTDPESYSLVTQAAYDQALEDANESVIRD